MDNKICIDLDTVRFFYMTVEQMDEELKKLKDMGLTAVNIMYDVFLDEDLKMFSDNLLKSIGYSGLKVVLHASDIKGTSLAYTDDDEMEVALAKHRQFLYNISERLEENKIDPNVKIIYHSGLCLDGDSIVALNRASIFYEGLANSAKELEFEILTELIDVKPMRGRLLGDCWSDFEHMCEKIKADNWGICWNTGNSRMNYVQYGDSLVPPDAVMAKIKLANIHSHIARNNKLAIYKSEIQDQEIKSLIAHGYKGMFNLEYVYAHLRDDNVDYDAVYDSIEYLNYVLTYFNHQYERGTLKITDDVEKMNRQSIRTVFEENTKVKFPTENMEFSKLELATHSLKIWSRTSLELDDQKTYDIEIHIKQREPLTLQTKFMMIREEGDKTGYVFKILNKDREIMKKVYETVYTL